MTTAPVTYQVVKGWNDDDIIALYRSAGWWRDYYDPSGIAPLIKGSFIFVVGIDSGTGRAVAMGRIISDGVGAGYIHDLCVLTEVRGMHIGAGILEFLVREAHAAGLSSLYLVAEPDTQSFYEKSGFISDNGLIFLTYNPDGQNET
ncbi:GNAT family N-acetyltransferase [uncultured Methanospirillum sp.]|uniref:GNAT family N-acetyltransferase n=1 Tax=uncultured Methanospirillum sp. TaxID=262503 RepID=UPI0029C96A84|nr:GNAT family N-acetyltransferase [uncultured Methanospirillum sp.]